MTSDNRYTDPLEAAFGGGERRVLHSEPPYLEGSIRAARAVITLDGAVLVLAARAPARRAC